MSEGHSRRASLLGALAFFLPSVLTRPACAKDRTGSRYAAADPPSADEGQNQGPSGTAWSGRRGVSVLQPFGWGISQDGVYRSQPYENGGSWLSVMPPERRDLIRRVGFDFVRLAIDPGPLLTSDKDQAARLIETILAAIDDLVASGLKVIADVHVNGGHPVKGLSNADLTDGPAGHGFRQLLRGEKILASALARTDPAKVALELFNEPPFEQSIRGLSWQIQQKALFDEIRSVLPRHTIVLTGSNFAAIDGLGFIDPESYDTNTIFTFHFYEPFAFALQSSTGFYEHIHRLTFPPNAHPGGRNKAMEEFEASLKAPSTVSAAKIASELSLFTKERKNYGLDTYFDAPQDENYIKKRIGVVSAWARDNRIPPARLLCGEFGVEGDHASVEAASPRSQVTWLRAVRAALETRGIPWVVHELNSTSDGFGIAQGSKPFTFRADILEALGLTLGG